MSVTFAPDGMSAMVEFPRPVVQDEYEWMNYLIGLARMFGWRVARPYTQGTVSDSGLPDVVMVRGDRLVWVETKFGTGQQTEHQSAWQEELQQVGGVEAYCWFPRDWDEAVVALAPSRKVEAKPDYSNWFKIDHAKASA